MSRSYTSAFQADTYVRAFPADTVRLAFPGLTRTLAFPADMAETRIQAKRLTYFA